MALSTIIKFPHANPVEFTRATNIQEYYWKERIPFFEVQSDYTQIFEQGDYIQFQTIIKLSNVDMENLEVKLRQCNTGLLYGIFQPVGYLWAYAVGYVSITWRLNIYLPLIPEGEYYIDALFPYQGGGNYDRYYSERISIKSAHEGSIRFTYTNIGHAFDMFFYADTACNTPLYFIFRTPGGFRSDGFAVGSTDNSFIDQPHNVTLLSSTPFDVGKLTIGSNTGVPNWVISKANRILSCTGVQLNGIEYTKNEGAKLEVSPMAFNSPLYMGQIEMIKSNNDYSDSNVMYDLMNAGGIGSATIGLDWVVSPNITPATPVVVPTDDIMRESNIILPAIVGGVEQSVAHGLNCSFHRLMIQIFDSNNTVEMATIKEDPANLLTHFIIMSEEDYAASALRAVVIGKIA
jgi:hypothetical protein